MSEQPIESAADTQNKGKILSQEEMEQQFKKEYEKKFDEYRKRPNVLVCGYTGSGKSSLIKAILGDVVPANAIGEGKPQTMGYDHYENDDISIWDSRGLELGETENEFVAKTREFIEGRVKDLNVDNHIHLVWYAIQGPGARITDCDLELLKEIFPKEHLIVVITKSDITRPNQKEALKKVLLENGIEEKRIIFTSDEEGGAMGCKDLMLLSLEMLPDAYKDAFAYAQKVDTERRKEAVLGKKDKAKGIIAAATIAAGSACAVPIPLSDAAMITPIQLGMIAGLAALYKLKGKELSAMAMPLLARTTGTLAASSLLKLIPGLGSVVNATVAASLTGAMGWFLQLQFEKIAVANALGLPPPEINFDFDKFRKYLEAFKKAGGNQ